MTFIYMFTHAITIAQSLLFYDPEGQGIKPSLIKKLDKRVFLEAWRSVAFLYNGLHPDEIDNPDGGWPKRLKPLAREAFRRFEIGEFSNNELYCYHEAMKGLEARRVKS